MAFIIDLLCGKITHELNFCFVLFFLLFFPPLAAFRFFLLSGALKWLDYDVPTCSFLHISCAWSSSGFLDLWIYSFHQIWGVSAIISSNIFQVISPLFNCPVSQAVPWLTDGLFTFLPPGVLLGIAATAVFWVHYSFALGAIQCISVCDIIVFISRSLIWVFLIYSMSLLNMLHLSFCFLNMWNSFL